MCVIVGSPVRPAGRSTFVRDVRKESHCRAIRGSHGCRGRLKPILGFQPRHMIEVADIAGDHREAVRQGGCRDQSVAVANGSTAHFPSRAELSRAKDDHFVQRQHANLRSHVGEKSLPKSVTGWGDFRAVADFLEADDRSEQARRFGLESRLDTRVRLGAHQLAQDVGIEQIHGSIKGRRRRAGIRWRSCSIWSRI